MKSNQQLVDECNALARDYYRIAFGHAVSEGYRFDRATHPQQRAAWDMAVLAYEVVAKSDVLNALDELEE